MTDKLSPHEAAQRMLSELIQDREAAERALSDALRADSTPAITLAYTQLRLIDQKIARVVERL